MNRLLLGVLAAGLVVLSGCASPQEPGPTDSSSTSAPPQSTSGSPGQGGNGFAIQQGTAHGSNQGIDLDVVWTACAAGFCANATATNNGSQAVQVSSICERPWTERMTHDGKEVQAQPPQAVCLAYGRAPFAPGDRQQAEFTWDGQTYDAEGHGSPAPQGSYTWTLAFWWDDPSGQGRQEAKADLQLILGET